VTPSSAVFELPLYFDLGATLLFGLSGALLAARRGYDPVGLFVVAMATGVGGGLLRDGLFLQQGPPVFVQDGRYLLVITLASALGYFFSTWLDKIRGLLFVVDALGLGIYAMVGAQKSLSLALGVGAAIFIGTINAVGGGLVRDILVREEPFLFKPGEYYALVAAAGASLFCLFVAQLQWQPPRAAAAAIAATFLLRLVSHRLGWRTSPARTGPHKAVTAG
jgi:uncharacterized membrane protein YeiH